MQTAVEWLVDKVTDMIHESNHLELVSLLEQAKQMEKEQLENARPQIISNCVIKEISDEEIEKWVSSTISYRNGFVEGAKWYREELKKNNEAYGKI